MTCSGEDQRVHLSFPLHQYLTCSSKLYYESRLIQSNLSLDYSPFGFLAHFHFKPTPPLTPLSSSPMSFNSVSSPSPSHSRHRLPRQFKPSQPTSERIFRALRHCLRLLHRSQSNFFVLGATGNVYTVTLSSTPSCTCPDRQSPCKHILFVYIKALGVPLDDTCLHRRTLPLCRLNYLLAAPVSPESLAGERVRKMFHRLFFQSKEGESRGVEDEIEDGSCCPICLEGMNKKDKVVGCGTCRNFVHQECWERWKRSRGRRWAICVICRARWREKDRMGEGQYLNLSAYLCEEAMGDNLEGGSVNYSRDN